MICHHHGDEEPGGADKRPVTAGAPRSCCSPRRADTTHAIGNALLAKANGAGHRTIAANLDRRHQTR